MVLALPVKVTISRVGSIFHAVDDCNMLGDTYERRCLDMFVGILPLPVSAWLTGRARPSF
jgi:hypothetical protein